MGLKELQLRKSYESDASQNHLLDDFYTPVLQRTKKYFRIAGFFSSTALSVAVKGIEELIHNNGTMFLLISPELSEEDWQTIRAHGSLQGNEKIFSGWNTDSFQDDHLKLLAWLLDNNRLKIKIVVGVKSRYSLFHQKVGIFMDENGDMVSFSGSVNETAQAWLNNVEEFKVFCSWNPVQKEYLESDYRKFLAYWKNEKPDVAKAFDIPETIREKLIQLKPRDVVDLDVMRQYREKSRTQAFQMNLFPHQQRAVQAWKENHFSLLMEMATGTGKTRTALACMVEKLKEETPFLTIVSTPQNTLSRQWLEDVKRLGIPLDRTEVIDGTNHDWQNDLSILLLDLSRRFWKNALILTTHSLASGEKFRKLLKQHLQKTKVLFICDEVHAAGANKMRGALLPEYQFRVGLSATPQRMFDEEGTSLIQDYFGGKSFTFTIADALRTINPATEKPFLNRFRYHPVFVYLSDKEGREYATISRQIAIELNKEEPDEEKLQRLYDRRADISKNAAAKLPAFSEMLGSISAQEIQDTLVFVSDKQLVPCMERLAQKGIMRAKITEDESASKLDDQGLSERQRLIKQFTDHNLQVLLGMKCLDEGIDIPNARVAFLLANSTNPREYVQRVGRVIRQAPNKPVSEIYDFITVHNSDPNLLKKEALRALQIAQNADNFAEVRARFAEKGVTLDAD